MAVTYSGKKTPTGGPESKWSCRESNPGPNRKPISFLHAYPVIGFRDRAGNRQPTQSLSPVVSPGFRGACQTIPAFGVPLNPDPQGAGSGEAARPGYLEPG